jgi:hypothetical protein
VFAPGDASGSAARGGIVDRSAGAAAPSDGVLVVAAVAVSGGLFVWAAVALHALGLALFCGQRRRLGRDEEPAPAGRGPPSRRVATTPLPCAPSVLAGERLALAGALCFCATPANVFFATAYSEATFAFLTFHGAAATTDCPCPC